MGRPTPTMADRTPSSPARPPLRPPFAEVSPMTADAPPAARPPSVERLLAAVRSRLGERELGRSRSRRGRSSARSGNGCGRVTRYGRWRHLEMSWSTVSSGSRVVARTRARPRDPVPVVNATGVIVHTNLGRATWPAAAISAAERAAVSPILLELDRTTGRRGARFRVGRGAPHRAHRSRGCPGHEQQRGGAGAGRRPGRTWWRRRLARGAGRDRRRRPDPRDRPAGRGATRRGGDDEPDPGRRLRAAPRRGSGPGRPPGPSLELPPGRLRGGTGCRRAARPRPPARRAHRGRPGERRVPADRDVRPGPRTHPARAPRDWPIS